MVEKEIVQLDKVKGAETLAVFAQLIDGVHATMPEDLKIVAYQRRREHPLDEHPRQHSGNSR